MNQAIVSGNGSKSTSRSRRHRDLMKREGCSRIEVTIGTDVAEKLKAVACKRGIPVWQAAEEAFEALAARYGV